MALLAPLEDFFGPTWPAVWTLVKIIAIIVPLMLCVAYLTLAEQVYRGEQSFVIKDAATGSGLSEVEVYP